MVRNATLSRAERDLHAIWRGCRRAVVPGLALAGVVGLGSVGGAAFAGAPSALGSAASARVAGLKPSSRARLAAAATSTRLAGPDRYSTAAAVSRATFPGGAHVAYLATGSDYPDALVAAAAAGGRGPVLLTAPADLPVPTAGELRRLGAGRVVIVGGSEVINDATVAAVRAALPAATVARLAGPDRYSTAARASSATFPPGVPVAYLATGSDYPDALAAAAAAGGRGPVLLSETDALPTATATELRRLRPDRVLAVGGSQAMTDVVLAAVRAVDPAAGVTRLAGDDRFVTAATVSRAAFPGGARVAFLATGLDYPDALTAAAAAGGRGPVLLAMPDEVPVATLVELERLGVQQVVLVGGTDALSQTTEDRLRQAAADAVAPPIAAAATAVATARAQLGKPYLWGGAGPDAFDCSGLTRFAWRAAGITLPRDAAAQAVATTPVDLSALLPGDLVFYGSPIGHVGLYIGGGQMIEAAHSGVPVRVADIHRPDLVGAGRPG